MRQQQVLASLFIFILAVVLGGPARGESPQSGGKSGKSAAKAEGKAHATPTPTATPAVNKYPDLEAKLKTAQAELAEAQGMLAAVNAEVSTPSLVLFGATADEFEKRAQMTRSLNYELERVVEITNRVRKLRDEQVDPTEEAQQLQIYFKQAPFTMDQVDELRGQIQDVRVKVNAAQTRRALTDGEIERSRQELKDAGVQVRQIQEKLETVKGQAEATRLRWQAELAKLAERLARARMNAYESSRSMQDQDLANQRHLLEMLDRKLSVTVANAPFTQEELNAKLEKLRENVRLLQKEQTAAAAARETASSKLEEAREALRKEKEKMVTVGTPAGLVASIVSRSSITTDAKRSAPPVVAPTPTPVDKNAPPDPNAKLAEKVAQLQAAANLRKEEYDTSNSIYNALRFMIKFLDDEQSIWQVRRRNTDPNDPEQYQEIQKWVTEGLDLVAQRKLSYQTNLDLLASQIATSQANLERWTPESGDVKILRQTLATQQARADIYRRGMELTRHMERLLQSWQAETQERLSHVTWRERWLGFRREAEAFVKRLWSVELFTVKDTIIVDGQEQTRPRSITVGKVISLLLILLLSAWLCHRVASTAQRMARVRFRAREGSARLLYKTIFFFGLLLVILVAMTTLKIPLTIFAFLGGALAIGVGFGAQNLINNFISGLILIFERPIKVGDIVEVEGLMGKVVNIGGRCSRVKRFDGIDILIPNSSFLEKNVVNWTHSDLLLRLKISVGVAYGSPAREASRLIQRAVEENALILKDPPPVVAFDDFGDNAMHFTVYFWVEQREGVDSRVVTSDVRYRIERLFRDAGISMPFPQRDVHLDASRPIPVSLVGDVDRVAPPRVEL